MARAGEETVRIADTERASPTANRAGGHSGRLLFMLVVSVLTFGGTVTNLCLRSNECKPDRSREASTVEAIAPPLGFRRNDLQIVKLGAAQDRESPGDAGRLAGQPGLEIVDAPDRILPEAQDDVPVLGPRPLGGPARRERLDQHAALDRQPEEPRHFARKGNILTGDPDHAPPHPAEADELARDQLRRVARDGGTDP